MIFFEKQKKTLRSFSMPEVMISMFVLAIGLVVIVAVMAGSLGYSYDTRDAIVGMGLAQEGVELVRNVRDSDFAAGNNGFTRFSTSNKQCRIDWNDPITSLDCAATQGSASRYYLQYSGAPTGVYAHNSTAKQKYSRYIYIDYDNTTGEENALVRSFVYWDSMGLPSSNGDPATCNASKDCVYTEIFLTHWKR